MYFLFTLLVAAVPTLDGRGMGARGFLLERTATNLELSYTRSVILSVFGTNILGLTEVNLLRLSRTILRKVCETFESFVLSTITQRSGHHEGYKVEGCIVQSLNSPFFPPHIGSKPGRAKEESRITCMRMLRTPPFFPPKSGEKPYLEVFSRFGLWRDF